MFTTMIGILIIRYNITMHSRPGRTINTHSIHSTKTTTLTILRHNTNFGFLTPL